MLWHNKLQRSLVRLMKKHTSVHDISMAHSAMAVTLLKAMQGLECGTVLRADVAKEADEGVAKLAFELLA